MTITKTLKTLNRAFEDPQRDGFLARFLEIVRMRLGFQLLGVSEYLDYSLDARSGLSESDRAAFLGYRRIMMINRECNETIWEVVSSDKLTFCGLMAGLQLPHTRILAIYDPHGRRYPGARTFTTISDAAAYLRTEIDYPFFVKPSHSNYGRGAVGVAKYDASSDRLIKMNGAAVAVEAFLEEMETLQSGGQMFQEFAHPHPALEEVCGPRATSVRVITGLDGDGAHVVSAVWKIPTGLNMMDNFMHGRSGNMLGAIGLETGRVVRVVRSVGGRVGEQSVHPDTGKELLGIQLPHWDEVKSLALSASLSLPGFRLHHWDLALTRRGPVFLEINIRGDMDLHQIASGRGIWTPLLRRIVEHARERRGRRRAIVAAYRPAA